MDTWGFMSPPFDGVKHEEGFGLRVDLGANAPLDEIASRTEALVHLLDLGERWAIVLAHEAAVRSLIAEFMAQTEFSLAPLKDVFNPSDEKRLALAVQEIREKGSLERAATIVEVPAVLDKYADAALPTLLGSSLRAETISYRNPIEWALVAGGFFIVYATLQVLKFAGGWRPRRGGEQATAQILKAQSRIETARADIAEYLAAEVTAGRINVPPSDLLRLVTSQDLKDMAALGPEVTLELPTGLSDLVGAGE